MILHSFQRDCGRFNIDIIFFLFEVAQRDEESMRIAVRVCVLPHWKVNGNYLFLFMEAMCQVLTYRLKGAVMRWDRLGADVIMALIALEQSNTWKSYWELRKQAA